MDDDGVEGKETRLFWTGMGSQRGEMKTGGTMKVCDDGWRFTLKIYDAKREGKKKHNQVLGNA
jgi:hypothetical protein